MLITKRYQSIAQVRAAHRAAGGNWFSRDTMRQWRSRIESGLYGGRFFITSEQPDTKYPRGYTVREAFEDGSIGSASQFDEFRTLAGAREYARQLTEYARQLTKEYC